MKEEMIKMNRVGTKPSKQILDFYAKSGQMTSAGKYLDMLKGLPNDVTLLTRIVQGLAIHEYVAFSYYGVEIPDNRRDDSSI